MNVDRISHWEHLYRTKGEREVSWFEREPLMSMQAIEEICADGPESVIDIGGGSSRLVDRLLLMGVPRIAVLDISEAALTIPMKRLGDRAKSVNWIVADVTEIDDVGTFELWHDRAVFHFLTEDQDRRRYVDLASRAVRPGGHVVIATFSLDGPDRCSGLDVCRYDESSLERELGAEFILVRSVEATHVTPAGIDQRFIFATFRRR